MNPSSGSLSTSLCLNLGWEFHGVCHFQKMYYISRKLMSFFLFFFLFSFRRKKAALQAWRPSEGRRSKRRRFFSVLWVAKVWASASPVVRHRNPASTSVMWSQAPCLQKLDFRWVFKMTRTPLETSVNHHSLYLLYVSSKNVGRRPDCGGQRSRFHQSGPQRGEFCLHGYH